jgi:hypothetical protein
MPVYPGASPVPFYLYVFSTAAPFLLTLFSFKASCLTMLRFDPNSFRSHAILPISFFTPAPSSIHSISMVSPEFATLVFIRINNYFYISAEFPVSHHDFCGTNTLGSYFTIWAHCYYFFIAACVGSTI